MMPRLGSPSGGIGRRAKLENLVLARVCPFESGLGHHYLICYQCVGATHSVELNDATSMIATAHTTAAHETQSLIA